MAFDIKAYMKAYLKEYNQRPEVKAKHRDRERLRRATPEWKAYHKAYDKEYYHRPDRHEKNLAMQRVRRTTAEWKEKARLYRVEYAKRPEVKAMQRDGIKRWKERDRKRWREFHRIDMENRRARCKGAEGQLTKAEWGAIVVRYDGRCLSCGFSGDVHIDHIIPLSAGGAHTKENVQPLCPSCNNSKRTKTIDYRAIISGVS